MSSSSTPASASAAETASQASSVVVTSSRRGGVARLADTDDRWRSDTAEYLPNGWLDRLVVPAARHGPVADRGSAGTVPLARDFARKEIAPHVADYDREERFPAEIVRAAGELGLAGGIVPAEYGGAGLDHLTYAMVDRGDLARSATSSRAP